MNRHPPARATFAAILAAALAGVIALGGCGVKGPLQPAPETVRKTPAQAPATTPNTAPLPGATSPPAPEPDKAPATPPS